MNTYVDIPMALHSLRPGAQWILNGGDYSGLVWNDLEQEKPTEEEVNAEIAILQSEQPLKDCKANAKELIAKSDWAVLPDVDISNKTEFEEYRATLRQYIINPVANPVWPTEPEPVWS